MDAGISATDSIERYSELVIASATSTPFSTRSAQSAACSHLHRVERAAPLVVDDSRRMPSGEFLLTQEFLHDAGRTANHGQRGDGEPAEGGAIRYRRVTFRSSIPRRCGSALRKLRHFTTGIRTGCLAIPASATGRQEKPIGHRGRIESRRSISHTGFPPQVLSIPRK